MPGRRAADVEGVDVDGRGHRVPPAERRAPQPLLYSTDQLLGRAPIRLRRAADRRRLAAHVVAATLLVLLSAWWVVPVHAFTGPVLVVLTGSHGVHVGDLPTVVFLGASARSVLAARRLVLAHG